MPLSPAKLKPGPAPQALRRRLLQSGALAAASLALTGRARAAAWAASGGDAYEPARFAEALAAGGPLALVFHAPWCGTCAIQRPMLRTLVSEPKFRQVKLFFADFDTAQALRQRYKVRYQSTVIVFKNGQPVARLTAEQGKEALAGLLALAL